MPLAGRDAAVLVVLLFSVPLQFWLTQTSTISHEQRTAEIFNLVDGLQTLLQKWFTRAAWKQWILSFKLRLIPDDYSHWYDLNYNDLEGQTPAVEVLWYRSPEEYFGMSPKPRIVRSHSIKWRVGQVVKHKRWGYKAVIVGWDPKCKAPEDWIEQMHQGKKHWRRQPNYALLVDTDDTGEAKITYVPQENIQPMSNTEIHHPELSEYFDSFDGAQYIPSKWLRAIYPHD